MWRAVGSSGKPLGLDWGLCFGDTHMQPGCSSAARPEGSECHYCGLTCSPNESLQLVIASLVKVEVAGKSRWGWGIPSRVMAHTRATKPTTSCKFRGFPTHSLILCFARVFTELTTVMLTVTIYYRKYRGRIQMHQGELVGWRQRASQMQGFSVCALHGVRMGGMNRALTTRMLP